MPPNPSIHGSRITLFGSDHAAPEVLGFASLTANLRTFGGVNSEP